MLLGGGVLLYFGAEWLVAGSAGLARAMGVTPLLIGLTVVAYGTSAPEVVVGVGASLDGHGAIALGNVLGSNVANIALILGVTALIKPAAVDGSLRLREVPMLVISALALPLLILDGEVSRIEGIALLVWAFVYTGWMVRSARAPERAHAKEAAAATEQAADQAGALPQTKSKARLAFTAALGLVGLVVGGKLLVDGATGIATVLGVSERIIGLTIVAVGTSLPELATSIIAALNDESDIAVGNVVGSNIFNVLLCLGGAAATRPVPAVLSDVAIDVSAMVALTLLAAFLLRTQRKITRVEGGILLGAYVLFLNLLVLEGAI